MHSEEFRAWIEGKDTAGRTALVQGLTRRQRILLTHAWSLWERPAQRPPDTPWDIWIIMAGRGFGKTRMGAEWVRDCAIHDKHARIALVAASLPEARAIMVEGESGVLSLCPPPFRPFYEPSLRRLTWPNGALAFLYSAAEPDSLRGPQHSHAGRAGPEGVFR